MSSRNCCSLHTHGDYYFMKRIITTALTLTITTLAPVSAMAVDVYGFVNIGLESTSITNNGAGDVVFATGVDGSVHANDVVETRFGFKDSKDLGNGLTAGYKIELGLGTSDAGAGGSNEDANPTRRIAQVSLSGDFGTVTAGNQWGILYEYLGWNVFRADGHGGGTWYYTTKNINDDAFGLRVSNAFTYTHGGGGYSADPFTISVQVIAAPDTPANDETFDAIAVGAAFTLEDLTINGVSYSESNPSGTAEPSLIGLGFRYNLNSDTYVGGNYLVVDNDTGADISSYNFLLTRNFGDGHSGMVSLGSGEGDNAIADLDSNLFLQYQKDFGKGVLAYVEIESAELAGNDETQVISLAMKVSF